MRERVKIVGETVLSKHWGVVKATTFEIRRRSGDWQRQVRETYDCGDGAAILLYDRERRTVILTRQFRFPAYANGEDGQLVEAPAGKLDGDDPVRCVIKEAEEETGYRIAEVEAVGTVYASPGSVTERLHLFIAEYHAGARVSDGGGLVDEGEDIEVLELSFDAVRAMLRAGEIRDAKTLILIQHLALKGVL